MSKEAVYIWDATLSNTNNIAFAQTATVNTPLVINSNIPYEPYFTGSPIQNGGPFIFNNVARTLSFTTTTITAGNILVTGFGSALDANFNPISPLNTPLSLTFALPNNTHSTNYVGSIVGSTTYIFSKVVSATPTALTGAGTIAIGYGAKGITNPYFFDDCRGAWYATMSAQMYPYPDATTLEYTFFCSLNKPAYPNPNYGNVTPFAGGIVTGTTFSNQIPAFTLAQLYQVTPPLEYTFENSVVSAISSIPTPITCGWFSINSNITVNESAIFTFLQQGVR